MKKWTTLLTKVVHFVYIVNIVGAEADILHAYGSAAKLGGF